ncbi:MAG: TatD family hydrolase [Bacteroidales bacterium]|nr:TatD family hydrolase [Bacteroidales bacterium]
MPQFINVHTHNPDNEGINILNINSSAFWTEGNCLSYGIHPWDVGKIDLNAQLKFLEDLCKEKKIVAIGEIGLDRSIDTPLDEQRVILKKQLELALKYQLPVILHSVRTNYDLLTIKKQEKIDIPWIFHGFRGSVQEATQLINNQCYLSFGKALLYEEKNQHVFKNIPLDWVFFETDDSDAKIDNIYQKAAEIIPIFVDDLKEKIFSNFIKVFGVRCTKNG